MKYKLAIFDFDGTLADSFPWFLNVINPIADQYRFKRIETDELERLRSYSASQLTRHLGVPAWKLPMIARRMRTMMAEAAGNISLFAGACDMLRCLSEQGVTLAIVSSNSAENIRRILGPECASLIRYYECGAALFGKQTKFRRVLKKSGVKHKEAICIGDEIRDIAAAHKEKIPFGGVSWGYTKAEALRAHAPSEIFTSMNDIVRKVA